jgi:RHS repeat-associated protein
MMKLKRLIFAIFLVMISCSSLWAYETENLADIAVSDIIGPVAFDTSNGTATAVTSKSLLIIDPCTKKVTEHALDGTPSALAVDSKRHTALVTLNGGVLTMLDLGTGTVSGRIAIGKEVHNISVSATAGKAMLLADDSIIIIDPYHLDKTLDISVTGRPVKGFAVEGHAVVLVDQASSAGASSAAMKVLLIDLETGRITKEAAINNQIGDIAVDGSSGNIYILLKDKIAVYDAELNFMGTIAAKEDASFLAINQVAAVGVIGRASDKSITFIDLASSDILKALSYSWTPLTAALDPYSNIAAITHKEGITFIRLANPLPILYSVVPDSAVVGAQGLSMSLKGAKFMRKSTALFDLKELITSFGNSSNLTAVVPSESLALPGDVLVSVKTPAPGGGVSNNVQFRILNPLPRIESVSPDAVSIKDGAVGLEIRGKGFLPVATVNFNGRQVPVTFKSSILLLATVELSDITSPGKYPISVVNPAQVSLTSNTAFLEVTQSEESTTVDKTPVKETPLKGSGTVVGRILNTHKEPVEGVTIKIRKMTAVTDADGRFEIKNVPAGNRVFMIHGSTAKRKKGKFEAHENFPSLPFTMRVLPNTTNVVPFDIHMHRQKDRNFKEINPHTETVLTDAEHPGVEMRIPKGVKITGWDGKANERVSIRTLAPDRLPVRPLPDHSKARSVYMFYFDKIGGGIPDKPIPFKARNDLGLMPGEKVVLWYYDESPNEDEAPNDWAVAGTGTVTSDGRYITTDPGVGIPKFCCGAAAWGGSGVASGKTGPEKCVKAGTSVDPATGYFIYKEVDYTLNGVIPVEIGRYYRSGDAGIGGYGQGTYFSYDWWIQNNSNMLLLQLPGNYQYQFPIQADGTFKNETDPDFLGDVLVRNTDSTFTLTKRNGWKYQFAIWGSLSSVQDPYGNTLTLNRDFVTDVSSIVTPEGQTLTFDIAIAAGDTRNYRTAIHGPKGTVTYAYNFGLKTVTYPDGSKIEYGYDANGRMTSVRKNEVLVVQNEYDANNRVTKQTHADGGTYLFSYAAGGGVITETTMTAPNGSQTTWGFYDYATKSNYLYGYIGYKITPDGTTIYEREPVTNLLKSVTDPLGRKMSYTYYADGAVKTVTDNLNNTTAYEYEPKYGLVSKVTDANNKVAAITPTYDSNNRITQLDIRDQLQKMTTIKYNSSGRLASVTDPNHNTTQLLYENSGKVTELTRIIDPLNNTVQMTYDDMGRVNSTIDPNGKSTTITYTPTDRIESIGDPLGGVTNFTYDISDNTSAIIDAKNRMTAFAYDERERIKQTTDPLSRINTYTYYTGAEITSSTGDNLKSITDRKGQITAFSQYDAMGRIKRIDYHDGSFTEYTYDNVGRLLNVSDSVSGQISFVYNDFGCTTCSSGRGQDRIAQVTTPLGTINYTYDELGRRKTMTVAGQQPVTYNYYDNGPVRDITQSVGGVDQKFGFVYDDAGRRASLSYYQGTSGSPVAQTTYGYDNANRLLNMQHQKGAALLEELKYEYDPNGNRTKFTRPGSQPIPNEITNTSYNDANEMLTFKDKTITYDANGNLQTVTNTCGATVFNWDARNRLVGITGFSANCSALNASFKYDALNRRIEKTINGTTTQYLYDGLDIIQEKQNGVVSANYIRGLNIDEPLMRIKSDGTKRLYKTDALGSVIALADETGAVKTTYTYGAFGNVTITGEASDNSLQFTGRENDNTGLYYYRARYYSPELQRFISEDPIGFSGGINFYAYVGNNPVNAIDPYGLFSITDLPAIPQPVVNFSAGLGDALLLGTGQYFRDKLGIGGVNRCSDAYKYGGWSSFAFGASRLAYAGLAKGGAMLAASGIEASAFRTALRNAFRLGIGTNWRTPNLAKYATDDALRAAAGRTNPYINAYGAGVAAAGGAEGTGCGCK